MKNIEQNWSSCTTKQDGLVTREHKSSKTHFKKWKKTNHLYSSLTISEFPGKVISQLTKSPPEYTLRPTSLAAKPRFCP